MLSCISVTSAPAQPEWVRIPAGTFVMGCVGSSRVCDKSERPAHRVTLTRPYDLAATLTTNEQYRACVDDGACPPYKRRMLLNDPARSDHPVIYVHWNDAVAYCHWVDGRLPTEAEWEFAMRGGNFEQPVPWPGVLSHEWANYRGVDSRDAWNGTSPVKAFPPTGYGIFDAFGNVWQLVSDEHGAYAKDDATDPKGPKAAGHHVARGGSYEEAGLHTTRRWYLPGPFAAGAYGFRCARDGRTAQELRMHADSLFSAGANRKARDAFRELAQREPHLATEASNRAKESQRRLDEQVAAAERERAEKRDAAARLAAQALQLENAAKWLEARDAAMAALARDPANPDATRVRSAVARQLGWTEPRTGALFSLIPAGTFTMGCTAGDNECQPREIPHEVMITRPFYLSSTETTNAQYQKCVEGGPCKSSFLAVLPNHPVVNKSWDDANAYCAWIGGRLPTEAEWEYAARGGHGDWRFPWGNVITLDKANYDDSDSDVPRQWPETSPVMTSAPNDFDLYGMAGNASEWVADWYEEFGKAAVADPRGPDRGTRKVIRGGNWDSWWRWLRVSDRSASTTDYRTKNLGFRCAKDVAP